LQHAQQRFRDRGIGLAAVSYDSQAILKDFSTRQGITFPLLADPQSEIIRRFGVLNTFATGATKGMAFPGFIYAGPDGRIKETFFEKQYAERYTANNVIAKLFPELAESDIRTLSAPHLQVRLSQSDVLVGPGSRITLTIGIVLPKDIHVYAPGVKGYKPIVLQVDPAPEITLRPAHYPLPKTLFLPAIHEKVPVFEGKFKISQDATISIDHAFMAALKSENNGAGKTIKITGTLFYQACDQKVCYLPDKLPVSWELTVKPLDTTRSPADIQHDMSGQ
jgi:AhpC/TSA family protein/cytochrome c biogenesis DsbD-like protein